jgi:hypothetical protein
MQLRPSFAKIQSRVEVVTDMPDSDEELVDDTEHSSGPTIEQVLFSVLYRG